MDTLQDILLQNEDTQSILNGISGGLKEQLAAGLSGSSRSLFIAAAYKQTNKPIMVITYNLLQAQKLYDDLLQFVAEDDVYLYAANELIAAEMSIASPELRAQRIEVLNHMVNHQNGIYIVPISGVRKLLPPKSQWKSLQKTFTAGEEIDLDETINELVQMGYQRSDMVYAPGEFSLRGGILDIYPLTLSDPIRIELFDTEIDSIRSFSIENQRSLENRSSVLISPVSETPYGASELVTLSQRLEAALSNSLDKVKNAESQKILSQNINQEIERMKNGQMIDGLSKYTAMMYENPMNLVDYLSEDGLVFFDEISRIREINDSLEQEEAEWYTALLEEGKIVHDIQLAYSFSDVMSAINRPVVYLSLFIRKVEHTNPQNVVNFSCRPMQSFHGQMNVLHTEIERWKKAGMTVIFLGDTEDRLSKIQQVLEDYEIQANVSSSKNHYEPNTVQVGIGSLSAGFEFTSLKLAIVTEQELFNKKTKKNKRRQKLSNAERIKSYSELKVGDYVVHVNHGIGKYLGIETLDINGVHKDYLNIKYQGTDQLYVPVEQIELVQKYVGSEGKEPKVYKLGGTEWKRVKSKVESSVQDIADDLIKLYAEREAAKGYAYSPDGDMQREFETAFPYEETEDQLRSIQEIKFDMEKEQPMDRLLCGDVGYGKTEVAIRAAFKAIADGKQVAFLVPTTILAQQHYETIKERFQDFPITVGLLSRFRTRKQQTETLKGLKAGTVDIVIGTHRLLSKDVQYSDLGLLIVDEEQRFGVTHKEKIKQLKTNVDVLTLTATPIPRTLHMSMLGVRDLSVIETPPENRFPVQTYVMEHNPALVREAIERELARDGQVFYLYNRVEDIERKAEEISMLVPDARVAYAHGQMTETELEAVILAFLEGETDVLVTTTIIETGVDIPNVNTLLVHDADRMGLSQLYQIRGRVGRSNRVAYAYFLYRKDKVLSETAEKRLQAIKEFTELGSGFKIAMRDLSIRGAGNLLGAQQHGFIDSVGFDLYSQMLKEAIEQKQAGDQKEKMPSFEVEISIDAYIPDTYIKDSQQKIEMYKRFRTLESVEEIDELKEEMTDRFGDYPREVDDLFKVAEMKVYARRTKLELIKQVKDTVTIRMSEAGTKEIDGSKVFDICNKHGRMVGLGMENNQLIITMDIKKVSIDTWFAAAYDIIKNLEKAKK
ncbi:transcription-repair coupling factor (superfamily II helicase) [Bacillus ectoiniformans]|uniref:transcription-repair coupling factor n=1 Tax=Bacillus ectoiniformans TaxID=1494429 RepID=UPI00195D1A41|nr:transcription-repair coupling factor [Bacillus ectoiniformans]MBM7650299.1 transcription-repair coupling factor (superfamily II helicase) [Bacillus ectoiniformans]